MIGKKISVSEVAVVIALLACFSAPHAFAATATVRHGERVIYSSARAHVTAISSQVTSTASVDGAQEATVSIHVRRDGETVEKSSTTSQGRVVLEYVQDGVQISAEAETGERAREAPARLPVHVPPVALPSAPASSYGAAAAVVSPYKTVDVTAGNGEVVQFIHSIPSLSLTHERQQNAADIATGTHTALATNSFESPITYWPPAWHTLDAFARYLNSLFQFL